MAMINNFFENVIDLTSDDILFFDTNVLVKLILENEEHHEAVKIFFVHTINQDCELRISETVVQELLFIIAQSLYTIDKVSDGTFSNVYNAKRSWTRLTKDDDVNQQNYVKEYNTKAYNKLSGILEFFDFDCNSLDCIKKSLELSQNYNLQSADAFILSNAVKSNGKLVTLDKDFLQVTEIETIYSDVNTTKSFDVSIYDHVIDHKAMYQIIFDK